MTIGPLAGCKVLDFSAFPPGAICTVMLADLGAEVIRVEPPKLKGRPSLLFGQVAMSRAKRSITLDMRNPGACEVLARLVQHADIVVEGARPGSMEARGWGYRQAKDANPAIIWCAITGFGQYGPNVDHSGHDICYLAHSGLLSQMCAEPGFEPGIQMAIPYGALCAVIGIQGALLERSRTGEGAFVDIALSEAASWVLTGGLDPLTEAPGILAASPERRRYHCSDGREVVLACAEPRTWGALCEELGLDDLKDRLFQWDDGAAVERKIGAILQTRPAQEWVDQLAPRGVAIAIVNRGSDLPHDPQVKARGTVVDCGGTVVPANPVRIASRSGATGTNAEPAPVVGQDTADILTQAGFSQEELADFTSSGLI